MILSGSLLQVIFARGGGGGSSGGGGDGGGIIAIIGYIPMHFLGAFFRRTRKDHPGVFTVLQLVGWLITIVYAILLAVVLKGIGILAGFGAFAGMGAGLYGWFGKLKGNKAAESQLAAAAAKDGSWNQEQLMTQTAATFQKFQTDWGRADVASMQQYLTPWYHYHVSLMMLALKQIGRTNIVDDLKITAQKVERVADAVDNTQDQVTIGFEAQANDRLVETLTQKTIFTDKNPFVEYWRFVRNGNNWLLDGIDQATANYLSANYAIQEFARTNQFGYSLDWGWLLLPQRGQLFGNTGKFGVSDVNNHVIGVYNNNLIQLYTYTPTQNRSIVGDQYLVAQMQLPKSYGDILVRRKKGFASKWFGVKHLDRVEMEWPDFNDKYEVFASTGEGPTSCELVNPTFMVKLEAAPFEINLEVVDNIVYFYTKETALQPSHYPAMLAILQEAFKQMKM